MTSNLIMCFMMHFLIIGRGLLSVISKKNAGSVTKHILQSVFTWSVKLLHLHVCMYVCMYVYIYIYIYIYIYTHKHVYFKMIELLLLLLL